MAPLKVYVMRASPPSSAVLATLTALEVPFEAIYINYFGGEHLKEEHDKRNPQREVPVLDDNGFLLSESVAIMQYLCEKYGDQNASLYPRDPQERAVVNHRLLFNQVGFYPHVGNHTFGAIFGLEDDPNKLRNNAIKALKVFETILSRQNKRFVAGDNVTIADFSASSAVLCMEASNSDITPYPTIARWYETFKKEHPKYWAVINVCTEDLAGIYKNPPSKNAFEKLDQLRNN